LWGGGDNVIFQRTNLSLLACNFYFYHALPFFDVLFEGTHADNSLIRSVIKMVLECSVYSLVCCRRSLTEPWEQKEHWAHCLS